MVIGSRGLTRRTDPTSVEHGRGIRGGDPGSRAGRYIDEGKGVGGRYYFAGRTFARRPTDDCCLVSLVLCSAVPLGTAPVGRPLGYIRHSEPQNCLWLRSIYPFAAEKPASIAEFSSVRAGPEDPP